MNRRADEEREARDPAPAVTRALRILDLLEAAEGTPVSLSDLARTIGAAKSSTSNICAVLERESFIRRADGGYRLGRRTAELGGAFARDFNQIREFYGLVEADPVLRGEVVQVAMFDDPHALYLARYEGRAHRVGTPLGSRLPAVRTATGLAMLSQFPPPVLTAILGRADLPRSERSTVGQAIAHVHAHGYAIDPERSFDGIWGVAAPLTPWRPSDPPLALGVALPKAEASPQRVSEVGEAVVRAAAALHNPFHHS